MNGSQFVNVLIVDRRMPGGGLPVDGDTKIEPAWIGWPPA